MNVRPRIVIAPDTDGLARQAAACVVATARASADPFCVALSGGSTPRTLYSLLSSHEYRDRVEWEKVHIFFADERCVPPDHRDSNYGMVRDRLLSGISIPHSNVHRMRGEVADLAATANASAAELAHVCRGEGEHGAPPLDLILLGIGDDGHTASLFPGTAALDVTDEWVAANPVPQLATTRLTLTFPVLAAARRIMFLVSGQQKAGVVKRVVEGDSSLPAARAAGENGNVQFMLDGPAASALR